MNKTAWATPVLHADIDAFYASVEVIKDPKLRRKPVIVGGTSNRGVVTSASYEARKFGVTSAMPTSRARRLCPTGIFIQPDFDSYAEFSHGVRRVFRSFSPVIEPLSLDEAFIDLKGAQLMWDNPVILAQELRRAVRHQTGLNVSAGLATNKFLAKLASVKAKPDGVVVVPPEELEDFLYPLPVSDLWGVGERTESILKRLGLNTIGDVASIPPATLTRALGSLGDHLARLVSGDDERPVVADTSRKSLGAEETYSRDLVEVGEIARGLLALSDRVASRLRAEGISGRTVTLKVRFTNFTTVTRSITPGGEIDSTTAIYQVVRGLLGAVERRRVRLLGVSVSNLVEWPASEQLSFQALPNWSRADKALDQIRLRFGDESLSFGLLLENL